MTADYTTSSDDGKMSAGLETQEYSGLCKKRLLLHCCCAPCASHVINELSEYSISLFFYNPNIEPVEEYERRRGELEKLASMYSLQSNEAIEVLPSEYNNAYYNDSVNSFKDEPEGGARCSICFDVRLGETAKIAKILGFDAFATTLTVSPHKNAAIVNDSGIKQSNEHDIEYLAADFKKQNGYLKSIELSKKYGLYRQNYCGCRYSVSI